MNNETLERADIGWRATTASGSVYEIARVWPEPKGFRPILFVRCVEASESPTAQDLGDRVWRVRPWPLRDVPEIGARLSFSSNEKAWPFRSDGGEDLRVTTTPIVALDELAAAEISAIAEAYQPGQLP